ncbi:hypothetical protein ACTWLT_19995 [Micromonospora sp. ZYX-F-536]|uniref:hypothetical protein n=1 Tax=Micromonospora sp. ZYX-F-536 TaxID=3457629 RepID=UPI0040408DE5
MTPQETPPNTAGRRRRAVVIGLTGGLAGILAVLLVVFIAPGDRWGSLHSSRSSSSATPASGSTSETPAQLARACIAQIKGQEALALFQRDIPADRWGDPVRGTASTSSEPYVLWLFDADCTPHRAIDVPPRTSRTFTAQVGQVWFYAEASAKHPVDSCACRVFSPSNNGTEQRFSDTGLLTYHLE